MKRPSATDRQYSVAVTEPARMPKVLSVSPSDDDHSSLERLIVNSRSALIRARGLIAACALLEHCKIALVVCERDLQPGTWIDVLEYIKTLPEAPPLIVASRAADEHLWAEALNLGAWDVLAKPFFATEVNRVISSALQHWQGQREFQTNRIRQALAAIGT